jgi:hypothetical protein
MPLAEIERWLGPVLGYDPQPDEAEEPATT